MMSTNWVPARWAAEMLETTGAAAWAGGVSRTSAAATARYGWSFMGKRERGEDFGLEEDCALGQKNANIEH